MKNILLFCLLLFSLPGLSQSIFSPQNLTAWCIVPFDKVKRGPEARIAMLKNILPYVVAINLNGMDLNKGQILPIGQGKSEAGMIQMIQALGFKGRIGVLGHRDDEDVEVVLKGNLEGLMKIVK